MTDKQIIIDGVDVSGCVKLRPYNECGCQPNYGGSYGLCSEWENCYYKQLKRTESKLVHKEEDLKQVSNAYEACKESSLKVYNKLQEKEQECERLKLDLIEAKAHSDYLNNLALSETLNTVSEELDQLKAELEQEKALKETYLACYKTKHEDIEGELFNLRQYKASKQASYEALQKKCNELELENRKLEADNDILTWQRDEAQKHQYCLAYDETCLKGNEKCIYSTCAFKSIFKLKALVRDIKHIAEDQKDVLESMRIDIAEQILQKISEVLDENI